MILRLWYHCDAYLLSHIIHQTYGLKIIHHGMIYFKTYDCKYTLQLQLQHKSILLCRCRFEKLVSSHWVKGEQVNVITWLSPLKGRKTNNQSSVYKLQNYTMIDIVKIDTICIGNPNNFIVYFISVNIHKYQLCTCFWICKLHMRKCKALPGYLTYI